MDIVEQSLRSSPDIEIVGVHTPHDTISALSEGMAGSQRVIIAKMTHQKAQLLAQQAGPQLLVERDQPLTYMPDPGALNFTAVPGFRDPSVAVPTGFSATFKVLGNNSPVKNATVYLFGSVWPTQGVTDAAGLVELTAQGESVETIRGLYVKPESDFWSLWISQPTIDPNGENTIVLSSLSETLSNFPQQQIFGWGQKAMKLDQLPPNFRGHGVKVAIIDSGAAVTHEDLQRIVKSGYDVIAKDPNTWSEDTVSHGSHCAGVVAGDPDNGIGIRGFAPAAQVFACKIFPGGMFSNLLDALDFCIEQQVDVVNLSLGGDEPSQIVEQKIVKAKQLGIACIVAAGNSGGPVQYPASSPNVLAVSAIGKQGEYPPDSYHSQTVLGTVTREGYFSAKFTCFGPQIGVCGPGVAIVSSVPPNNYAAWDGTSMAAPHITGVAALVLAHHPDFQQGGAFSVRGPHRVERLFQIIKQSAQPIDIGDPTRTGAGLPDVTRALGIQPTAGTQPQSALFGGAGVSFPSASQIPFGGGAPLGGHLRFPFIPAVNPYTVSPAAWDPRTLVAALYSAPGINANELRASMQQGSLGGSVQPQAFTPFNYGPAPFGSGVLGGQNPPPNVETLLQQLRMAMQLSGLL